MLLTPEVAARYPRRERVEGELPGDGYDFLRRLVTLSQEDAWDEWDAGPLPGPFPPGSDARKVNRKPVFYLTPPEAIQICRDLNYTLSCAGQMLALMDMMRFHRWPVTILAARAQVSRTQITGYLRLKSFLSIQNLNKVIAAVGLEEPEFFLLAKYELQAANCRDPDRDL